MKRWIFAVSIALAPGAVWAQLYKCTNAAGKVTYSGQKCSQLGLKDAGEVKDTVQSAPGDRAAAAAARKPAPPPPPPKPQAQEPPKAAPPAATAEKATAEKAEEPPRRCFVVKTAKGNVTRCAEKEQE